MSTIVIDSDALKSIIPTEKKPKEILAITQSMKKRADSKVENKNGVFTKKPDQLFIWECTSISDVKGLTILQFDIDATVKEPHIFINDLKVVVRCSDNLRNTQMRLEKLLSQMQLLNID